jgi:hypothetical protein
MKNIIFIIASVGLVSSCIFVDPQFHDDFIIQNNCNENITVAINIYNGDNLNFDVSPISEYVFYDDEWVGGISHVEKINQIFSEIIITKNGISSKINYANYKLWRKENVQNSHRANYYTDVKYYLEINQEDFE